MVNIRKKASEENTSKSDGSMGDSETYSRPHHKMTPSVWHVIHTFLSVRFCFRLLNLFYLILKLNDLTHATSSFSFVGLSML